MQKNLMKESVLFITGRRKNLKLNGPRNEIKAYLNVLRSSKNLYEALEDKNAKFSEITKLISEKNNYAKKFYIETGVIWPL